MNGKMGKEWGGGMGKIMHLRCLDQWEGGI